MSFKLAQSGLSSVDDCDSGLLELKGICGCSVGNLFVACLGLSMFVSVWESS